MSMEKAVTYINVQLKDRMNLMSKYFSFVKDS